MHDAGVDTAAESAVIKQIARFGGALPDRVTDKPKPGVGLDFYLIAFFDLDTERDLTNLQPIPWSAIVAYANLYEANVDDLTYFIRKMDNAYLNKLAAKRKAILNRR